MGTKGVSQRYAISKARSEERFLQPGGLLATHLLVQPERIFHRHMTHP